MFTKSTKRTYELDCEKGFFIVEMEDIKEKVCNTRTGETSVLKKSVYYRLTKDCGITTFFIGGYVTKGRTEEEELESIYDTIVNSDFFDADIILHHKEMFYLENMMEVK